MSKLIHEYENNVLINQIKYVVMSNLNETYPYYHCTISNATYNNYRCCFYKELAFKGNRYEGSSENINIEGILFPSGIIYSLDKDRSSCVTRSYSQINQDLEFTNVANNESGLIDLGYEYKLNQSVSSSTTTVANEVISNNTWLFFISAILVFMVLQEFIHYLFNRH